MASSAKALLEWCRVTCAGYPGVEINDMSASFRDGLAFCAIIHKHRPDLIDFSSLSRGNVHQNNKLAFEVAEAKLGIPPLLDPKEMVSTSVPDFLSVITYIAQYYSFFSGKSHGPCRSRSAYVLNITTVNKTLKSQKSLSELETSKEDSYSGTRTRAVCSLCFKPIHLIQRHLIDGKLYHRSCFRCKVCSCVLLPGSYTQGNDKTSFICTHHATDGRAAGVDSKQRLRSADGQPERSFQTGVYSLSGLAICSVPRYARRAESRRDGLVSDTRRTEVTENLTVVDGKEKKTSELSLNASRVTEGSAYPVPAPRRSVDSSLAPVPAPRSRSTQTMSSSPAAETQREYSPHPPCTTSPRVKTNHPWMGIVHPGPWTQLPPVPPPVPLPRSKSVSNTQTPWNRPKPPTLNPFEEEEDAEEAQVEAGPSAAAVHPENRDVTHVEVGSRDGETPAGEFEQTMDERCPLRRPFNDERGGTEPDPASGAAADVSSEGSGDGPADVGQTVRRAAEPEFPSAQSSILPRSLSVPAIPSERSDSNSVPAGSQETTLSISSCASKAVYKENTLTQEAEMPRSQTVQNLSSSRGPAPGHGFPLIRRQVRTDPDVSTEDLRTQMRNLDGHLGALEQRGVELERNIRGCKMGKEEQMLTEWFALVHEQRNLLRKNKELVYLTKQQILEDRQADVEYELRCLLNKPEKDWSKEDRGREEQLMAELVTIIEQRNQIISSLDQDRERDENAESRRNKGVQKEGLKERKKSKGKLNASKVFKILNHKTESSKEATEKNS